jgi:hypothetical protein
VTRLPPRVSVLEDLALRGARPGRHHLRGPLWPAHDPSDAAGRSLCPTRAACLAARRQRCRDEPPCISLGAACTPLLDASAAYPIHCKSTAPDAPHRRVQPKIVWRLRAPRILNSFGAVLGLGTASRLASLCLYSAWEGYTIICLRPHCAHALNASHSSQSMDRGSFSPVLPRTEHKARKKPSGTDPCST